ncbi:MAG: hypothetical protein JWN95_2413 [Frankiales bacterium]|nr:hypothetical protein [Frankiales bacterium]
MDGTTAGNAAADTGIETAREVGDLAGEAVGTRPAAGRPPRKLVICLDGTGQQIGSPAQPTNVAKIFQMLDLTDATRQLAYYDPGVGTLPSTTARGKLARAMSRVMQLAFGWGLRTNLSQAYVWLMQHYQPGDEIYIFGFSRGAYTARALAGILTRPGLLRPGSDNLVDYAIREYATNRRVDDDHKQRRNGIEAFSDAFCWGTERNPLFPAGWIGPAHHEDWHCVPVTYMGVWDTVEATGFMGFGRLKWPFTYQLFNVQKIRHAVSIDEHRRPYKQLLIAPRPTVQEVWFAGVHSDIGGTFDDDPALAEIALKWVVDGVVDQLILRDGAYAQRCASAAEAYTGKLHQMGRIWDVMGVRKRVIPEGAGIHQTVMQRFAQKDLDYRPKLPRQYSVSE